MRHLTEARQRKANRVYVRLKKEEKRKKEKRRNPASRILGMGMFSKKKSFQPGDCDPDNQASKSKKKD